MAKNLISLGRCYGADTVYEDLFKASYRVYNLEEFKEKIDKNSVVLFGGGEDISPALYGEKCFYKVCHAGDTPSRRDQFETEAYKIAQDLEIPSLGICRGAQLLCALAGGKLVQHVNGHGSEHPIETWNNQAYITSSVHHQMMLPEKTDHELIAWTAPQKISNVYMVNKDIILSDIGKEPEIVYFKKSKGLGIQGHPEFMDSHEPFVRYTKELVKEFLL